MGWGVGQAHVDAVGDLPAVEHAVLRMPCSKYLLGKKFAIGMQAALSARLQLAAAHRARRPCFRQPMLLRPSLPAMLNEHHGKVLVCILMLMQHSSTLTAAVMAAPL